MYVFLLFIHSIFRWLVLVALVYAILTAISGYRTKSVFGKTADRIRHWTATIAHIQLMIGFTLYFNSPVIRYFFREPVSSFKTGDAGFFGLIHLLMMVTGIFVLTIGSAMAKRKPEDADKFRIMAIWFSAALLIILAAIPWPFSPLASRPLFRPY